MGKPKDGKYKDYLEFLETAVASEHLKTNDPVKWEVMRKKLERERFLRKVLKKK